MAYSFNGTSQYLNTSVAPPISGTPLTIACWARMTNVPSQQVCVALGISSASHRNQIGVSGSDLRARAASVGTLTTGVFTDSTTTFALNSWVHITGVFPNNSSRTVYLNAGGSRTNTANAGVQNLPNSVSVGVRWNNSLGLFLNGQVAEVGIWNGILSLQEIESLSKGMTCDKISPQNIVFYAPLVRDLQENKGGLTITNNNSAAVTAHPRIYV